MGNFAWPHTPGNFMARLVLVDGPYAEEVAGFLPPNVSVPDQIAWSGYFPWGFACYVYARTGERTDRGRVNAITYRFLPGATVPPPAVAADAELFEAITETVARIAEALELPPELLVTRHHWRRQ